MGRLPHHVLRVLVGGHFPMGCGLPPEKGDAAVGSALRVHSVALGAFPDIDVVQFYAQACL
jgi:hypothetical protein